MIYQGASKIDSKGISSVLKGFSSEIKNWNKLYDDFINAGILKEKINNFGRISKQSKQTIFSVALALHDANITFDQNRDSIAIIGNNQNCCQQANSAYFKDYVKHGRSIGRGNLFVNTLPTTPIAMAGIACELHGLLYFSATRETEQISSALEEVELLLENNMAIKLVLVLSDDSTIASFVFGKGQNNFALSDLDVKNGIKSFFESIRFLKS